MSESTYLRHLEDVWRDGADDGDQEAIDVVALFERIYALGYEHGWRDAQLNPVV